MDFGIFWIVAIGAAVLAGLLLAQMLWATAPIARPATAIMVLVYTVWTIAFLAYSIWAVAQARWVVAAGAGWFAVLCGLVSAYVMGVRLVVMRRPNCALAIRAGRWIIGVVRI